MAFPTPLHDRTSALCETLNYREWAGYFAVGAYEPSHEHEYHALRHAAGLLDISPLFKYIVAGPDAVRLVDRVITRNAARMQLRQVVYTPWCDEHGSIVDDGTVTRLDETQFFWTAANPSLRWLTGAAVGLDVRIDDVSERTAAMALQGPASASILRAVSDVDADRLKYFRMVGGQVAGHAVEVSRTGYTGDLGYEIWVDAASSGLVWDAVMIAGRDFGLRPVGLLALDVARIEAGLLLTDVDFFSARKALTPSQRYSPLEMGLGRLVDFDKDGFVGRAALAAEKARGVRRRIVGLTLEWPAVERLYADAGLPAAMEPTASRLAVPVFDRSGQVGRMTSSTWSPVLKKLIGLATVDASSARPGTRLEVEHTVDAVRHHVEATVVATPFFNPKRKTATPPVRPAWPTRNGRAPSA